MEPEELIPRTTTKTTTRVAFGDLPCGSKNYQYSAKFVGSYSKILEGSGFATQYSNSNSNSSSSRLSRSYFFAAAAARPESDDTSWYVDESLRLNQTTSVFQ